MFYILLLEKASYVIFGVQGFCLVLILQRAPLTSSSACVEYRTIPELARVVDLHLGVRENASRISLKNIRYPEMQRGCFSCSKWKIPSRSTGTTVQVLLFLSAYEEVPIDKHTRPDRSLKYLPNCRGKERKLHSRPTVHKLALAGPSFDRNYDKR